MIQGQHFDVQAARAHMPSMLVPHQPSQGQSAPQSTRSIDQNNYLTIVLTTADDSKVRLAASLNCARY